MPPLVIVGDSFAAGVGATHASMGYPNLLQGLIGSPVVAVAAGGTGFRCDGPKRKRVLPPRGRHERRLGKVPSERQALIIQASANDRFYDQGEVEDALRSYLRRLPGGKPALIFGPIYCSTRDRPERVSIVVDAHRAVAEAEGIPYVDALPWFADAADRGWVAADGGHPSDAGHMEIAQRLTAVLGDLEIA